MSLLIILTLTQSCKRVRGCTDPAAENYNPDAEKDDASCDIRYLDEIVLHSHVMVDGNGDNWDFGSEADLLLQIAPASSTTWTYSTNEYSNTIPPVNMLAFPDVKFTNETWQFRLMDIDNLTEDCQIGTGTFNPLSEGADGTINVNTGDINVSFRYSTRRE